MGAAQEPIYSANPKDPWNKIFFFLFSRRLTVRCWQQFHILSTAPTRTGEVADGERVQSISPSKIVTLNLTAAQHS
jgi:hypothetical protein